MVDESSLNTAVIQAYDPSCTTVLDKSSSVHLYTFNPQSKSWVKSKIGGVLFLYRRSKLPLHSFMVLNRKSPNVNQVEFITSSLQVQLHSPFMLYKTGTDIFSLWFFSPEDCVRISERIGHMVFDLGGARLRVAPDKSLTQKVFSEAPVSHSTKVTQGLNQLLSILRRSGEVGGDCVSHPLQVYDGNESALSMCGDSHQSRKAECKIGSPNVFELLHKAEADFNSQHQSESLSNHEPNINSELQRLLTACNISSVGPKAQTNHEPTLNTVSLGDVQCTPSDRADHFGSHISVAELEQRLLREHVSNFHPISAATDGSSNDERRSPRRFNYPRLVCSSADVKTVTTSPGVIKISSTRLQSDLDAGYVDDIDETYESDSTRCGRSHGIVGVPQLRGSGSLVQRKHRRHTRAREDGLSHCDQTHHLPTFQNSQMSPRPSQPDFASNVVKGCNREEAEGNDDTEEVLVTPAMLSNTTTAFNKRDVTSPLALSGLTNAPVLSTEPCVTERFGESDGLTKEQLRQALIFMLQNDDEFLNHIHSAYMMSLRQRLSKL